MPLVLLFAMGCEGDRIPLLPMDGAPPEQGAQAGNLRGIEAVADSLPYEVDPAEPVSMLLSKSRYPAEDGHLDAILWLGPDADAVPQSGERLVLTLRAEDGHVLWSEPLDPLPGRRIFLSPRFPSSLAGGRGSLTAEWFDGERRLGSASGYFTVAASDPTPVSGRVAVDLPNEDGVTAPAVPLTVGVPFPRGALQDAAHLRLVDEAGREIPLQVKETARWSRFGSVKWVLCDFIADLSGGRRRFHLEYGPDVSRVSERGLSVSDGTGFPVVETGRLRADAEGLWFRGADGTWRRALDAAALAGGYVVHEDGREYRMEPDGDYAIEEAGPEKIVVLRRGWFRDPDSGAEFCRYVTRVVLSRDSPLVRIFHTWIFTGDAYTDRIRDAGWRFPAAAGLEPEGFLTAFGEGGGWQAGDYLLQHDHDAFEIVAKETALLEGERAPGVLGMSGGEVRVLAGVRDFWQNYPHELGFADGGMTWHLWPRHGKPVRHAYDTLDLREFQRLWFAHEGELLDFAMPKEYFTRPEILASMHRHTLREGRYRETANAQGVAKTTEIWLHFSDESTPAADSAGLLEGLQTRGLRAVVDPSWVCSSGAFFEVHPYDPDLFPEEEAAYALHARAPAIWAERLRYYGKWIWGDVNWQPHLRERFGVVYRGFRKAHQGWPYSWLPYARSGTPEYLAFADAATRYLADIAFCHYADERVDVFPGMTRPRPRGFHIRFSIPWASHRPGPTNRDYVDKCNYLWHAYYLTGYGRARDVALDWGYLAKHEPFGRADVFGDVGSGDPWRITVTALQSFVDMYEAVHDPWFLAAAHQVARRQVEAFRERGWRGIAWNAGPREFMRLTGCPEFAEFYRAYAYQNADPDFTGLTTSYFGEAMAFGWLLTGDPHFVRRLLATRDELLAWTYDGEPDYYHGVRVSGSVHGAMAQFTGNLLQYFPAVLHVLARAGQDGIDVTPLRHTYFQLPPLSAATGKAGEDGWTLHFPPILIRKAENESLPLRLSVSRFSGHAAWPWVAEVRPPDGGAPMRLRWSKDHGLEGDVSALAADAGDREPGYGQGAGLLRITIPSEAPPGVYELRLTGHSTLALSTRPRHLPGLLLPVSAGDGLEVFALDAQNRTGPARDPCRYAFAVPEGHDTLVFRCDISGLRSREGDCSLVRMTLWNHRGERVGVAQADRTDLSGDELVLRVPVAPDNAGEIWEVAVAHPHSGVQFDPAIFPWVSTQRERWFDPER